MKILILGSKGQVGWELQRSLSSLGDIVAVDREELDLCDLNKTEQFILDLSPNIIVNAAAYTAVDNAETDQATAMVLNHALPAQLAKIVKKIEALLIHYSTDYVYSGIGDEPHMESLDHNPLNFYGKTKAEGDEIISCSGCRHFIFRTSWVYSARQTNFVKTMMKLAQTKEELHIINDQIGAPTSAELIADVTAIVIYRQLTKNIPFGVYHLVSDGYASWYEFTTFIVKIMNELGVPLSVKKVMPILTSEYPTKALRPLNSRLTHDKIESVLGIKMPHWQNGVKRVVEELVNK